MESVHWKRQGPAGREKERGAEAAAGTAGGTDEAWLEDGWDEDWEEDWEDDERLADEVAMSQEIGLPLSQENFVTGVPLITVDDFELTGPEGALVADALLSLEGAVLDEGADDLRIMVFEPMLAGERLDTKRMIAVLTLRGRDLRLETARRVVTDPFRQMVEETLGDRVRYLRRRRVDPFEPLFDDGG